MHKYELHLEKFLNDAYTLSKALDINKNVGTLAGSHAGVTTFWITRSL